MYQYSQLIEQSNIYPVLDPEYAYILIRCITLRMRMKNTEYWAAILLINCHTHKTTTTNKYKNPLHTHTQKKPHQTKTTKQTALQTFLGIQKYQRIAFGEKFLSI